MDARLPRDAVLWCASLVLLAVAGVACSSSSSSADSSDSCFSPPRPLTVVPQPPPPPVVTAQTATHLAAESGLCQKWSSTALDLSPLATGGSLFAHGFNGGFSFASADLYTAPVLSVLAMAFDSSGKPTGKVVSLPPEPQAYVYDVIATGDGGWLVAWSGPPPSGPCSSAPLYLVRYDGTGAPVKRTELAVPGQYPVIMLDGTADGEALVWCGQPKCTLGRIAADSAQLTVGAGFDSYGENVHSFVDGILLTVDFGPQYSEGYRATLRTWNPSGAPLIGITLPAVSNTFAAAGSAWAYAPTADGSAAVFAKADAVGFISQDVVNVLPTDIPLAGASPLAEASSDGHDRIVVGFTTVLPAPGGGGEDAVEIVDISSSGARGVVGQAVISPGACPRSSASSVSSGSSGGVANCLQLVATPAQDAYAVAYPMAAAVFSCVERSP